MPDLVLTSQHAVTLPQAELEKADATLQKLGLLAPETVTNDRAQEILAAAQQMAATHGLTEAHLALGPHIGDAIASMNRRFCGVADTPPQTDGTHVLAYGTPIGIWPRGNLKYNISTNGIRGVDPLIAAAIFNNAYAAYQAIQPFFNFSPGGSDSELKAQFKDFTGDPDLKGASGYGNRPTDGNCFFDATINWDADGLTSVALHEIGHTLGLSHSTNPSSIMYPSSPRRTDLDSETIQALQGMYGWLPQRSLNDRASTDGPSLAFLSEPSVSGSGLTMVFMAWTGSEHDSGLYFSSSDDGLNWSPQQGISNVGSTLCPALATYHVPQNDGVPRIGLIMAWKGIGDDTNIWWSINITLQADGWSDQQRIDVGTSARPALAEFNNQMVLAWKGIPGDSGIYWSKLGANGQWESQKLIVGRGTSTGPTLVAFEGQLHMYWKGIEGDSNAYHAVLVDPLHGIWGPQEVVTFVDAGELDSGETPVAISTSSAIAATVRGDELVLAWRGSVGMIADDTLWFARYKGGQLSGPISISNVGSSAGPGLSTIDGHLVMAWRGIGDDRGLWVSML